MKTSQLLIPLLLAVFLFACSRRPNGPTEADARAALEQEIKDFSQRCIKLVEFHKTGETALGSVILVEASAEIEFLEDCNWPMNTLVMVTKSSPGATPNVSKGDHRTLNVKLQFHQTGQGWKATQKKDLGSKPTQ
jgi:hypothetical protein